MSEIITHPAPVLSLVTPPKTAWERERRAFRELLPALRATHDGLYAGIYDHQKDQPAHNPVTLRLMPSLIRGTSQLIHGPGMPDTSIPAGPAPRRGAP